MSVVIPLFNRQGIVLETLRSLEVQSHRKFEAIVVDDHSSDGGPEQVQSFARLDDRFRLLRRDTLYGGATACRNVGLKEAKGDFVIFLDSDDLLSRGCIAGRLESLARSPDADLVVAQALLFRSRPGDSRTMWNRAEFGTVGLVERFLDQDVPWQTGGVLWRKSYLESVGCWNTDLACFQDWEFHIRACLLGPTIAVRPVPDFYVRRSESVSQISQMHNAPLHVESRIKAMDSVCSKLTEHKAWTRELRDAAKGFLIRNYLLIHTQGLTRLAEQMLRGQAGRSLTGLSDRMLLRWIATKGDVWRWDSRVNRVASIIWRGIAYNDVLMKNDFMSAKWNRRFPEVDEQVAE